MLARKDDEEEAALQELTTQAKVELHEWYARNEEQLSQTKSVNRCGWVGHWAGLVLVVQCD